MEDLQLIGYLGAALIGIVVGLVGGGGSILAVPVLVYLFSESPTMATAYSLFIVGSVAAVGIIVNVRRKLVDFRTGLVFAAPSLVAVYLTRKFIMPAIPEKIIEINGFVLEKDMAIMIFFAVIMFFAGYSMIKGRKESNEEKDVHYNYPLILLEGLVVGLLTGIVGAGGGFVIIPALVLFSGLSIKKAIATSLLIITIKSLIGFIGDVQNLDIEWDFLILFTTIAVIGVLIGLYLNKFISAAKLRKGFGWFVLVMACVIILKEVM